jgi:hypothetical protein
MGTRCAATIIIAALAGLCMGSVARTVCFPERVLTNSSEASRTPGMFRPSTAPALKLIFDVDAKYQQEERWQLFNPYYYHPRLLSYYEPIPIAHATKLWPRIRGGYPGLRGVYWVHGFVGPDGLWWYPQYGRRLNQVPGIEDPSEISDIGWERMLSRIPGIVVR